MNSTTPIPERRARAFLCLCGRPAVVLRPMQGRSGAINFCALCELHHYGRREAGDVELSGPELVCSCGERARALVLRPSGAWLPACAPPTGKAFLERVWWLPWAQPPAGAGESALVDVLGAVALGFAVVAVQMPCMVCGARHELLPAGIPLCSSCRGVGRPG